MINKKRLNLMRRNLEEPIAKFTRPRRHEQSTPNAPHKTER